MKNIQARNLDVHPLSYLLPVLENIKKKILSLKL
jgi:hypothetical protein